MPLREAHDLLGVSTPAGVKANQVRFKPFFRLVILSIDPAAKPRIINLKPFRREDLAVLLRSPQLRLKTQ